MEDILTHCLKPSLEHISIVYSCLLIDASDNMCNALYFAQKSPKLKLTSLA